MPEFFGYIKLDAGAGQIAEKHLDGFIEVSAQNFFIHKKYPAKFGQDAILYHDHNCLVCINGVVLNRLSLQQKHKTDEFGKAVFAEYRLAGTDFCRSFRGTFSGLLFDKLLSKWFVFTSHFGDKQVFYSLVQGTLFFGSKVADVSRQLKEQQIDFSIDEQGIGSMLTYGFMLEDLSLIKEIKKLSYGSVIEVEKGKALVKKYWDFDNTRFTNEKEKDILGRMDFLFRQATALEFEKDREYQLEHLATLSAGLDSKMAVVVSHELGYKKQLNFTYSRHQYADQTVAQQIAHDLGHSFVFSLLNENNFFEGFEELAPVNSGRCSFAGNISGFNSIRHLNFTPFGVVHTGQLGDVVFGTFNKRPGHAPVREFSGAFSSSRYPVAPAVDWSKYPNNEKFLMTQRGFNGALQGNLIYQEHTEVCSPFMDVDLFEYCMSIPPELRFNHRLYLKWIKQYYPLAAGYVWDKTMAPLTVPLIRYKNILFPVSNLWHVRRALLPRIGKISKRFRFLAKQHSMTPLQFWYEKNKTLQHKIDSAIRDSGFPGSFSNEINEAMYDILTGNDLLRKSQLLTVTEGLKTLL